MADIASELYAIENAIYGSQMRTALHDSIEKVNIEVTSDTTSINNLKANSYNAYSYSDENGNSITMHFQKVGKIVIVTAVIAFLHPELLVSSDEGDKLIISDVNPVYRPISEDAGIIPLPIDCDGSLAALTADKLPCISIDYFSSDSVSVYLIDIRANESPSTYDVRNNLYRGRFNLQTVYKIYEE